MKMKIRILEEGLGVTKGRVYDAVKTPHHYTNIIEMVNEDGLICQYYYPSAYFQDVTIEYRDSLIDEILK